MKIDNAASSTRSSLHYVLNLNHREHINKSKVPNFLDEDYLFHFNYLAHRGTQKILSTAFKMGRSTANSIFAEICDVFQNELGCIHL